MHGVYQIKSRAKCREIWIALVETWRSSGLTAQQFSTREKIKYADLKRWHYRLGRKNNIKPKPAPLSPSVQFIPLSTSLIPVPQNNHYIDVIINHDYRLRVYPN